MLAAVASAAIFAPLLLSVSAAHADPESPTSDPAAGARTPLAIVLPITVPTNETGIVSSEELADYTSATGALTRILDAAVNRPVALAIDPMIIASIRVLGTSAPDTATEWLNRLSHASNETFALPYADADVAAQAQAGITPLLGPTSFNFALSAENFTGPLPAETPSELGTEPTPTPTTLTTTTTRRKQYEAPAADEQLHA